MGKKIIWIVWQFHRRTTELASYYSIPLVTFSDRLPRFYRHPINTIKTILTIIKEKPNILFIQSPSLLLAFVCCLLRSRFKYALITDAHNAVIQPDNRLLKNIYFINKFIIRNSDLTIITNQFLIKPVISNSGNPFILPDKIPTPPNVDRQKLKGTFNFLYICSFTADEPFNEVFNAAKYLPTNVFIYVTGRCPHKIKENINYKHSNIIFTGYVEDDIYWSLLSSVNVAIDLTYRENCLVCGAYEAISVGTPLILSDTRAMRAYFYKGVIFTKNNHKSIIESMIGSMKNQDEYTKDIHSLKLELKANWEKQAVELDHLIKFY